MAKNPNVFIEIKDGLKVDVVLGVLQDALKEIDTQCEVMEGNMVQWNISKNVPGYSVIMRDEGMGEPMKFIVGKAPRVRKNASKDKTVC